MVSEGSSLCSQEPSTKDPVLSHTNPVHTLTPYFLKLHFNIILPSIHSSPRNFFPFNCLTKILYVFLIVHKHGMWPTYLILLDSITLILFCEDYKFWNSSLCNFCSPPVTTSLFSTNIFLSIPFPNTLNLLFSFSMRDLIFHPYNTTCRFEHFNL